MKITRKHLRGIIREALSSLDEADTIETPEPVSQEVVAALPGDECHLRQIMTSIIGGMFQGVGDTIYQEGYGSSFTTTVPARCVRDNQYDGPPVLISMTPEQSARLHNLMEVLIYSNDGFRSLIEAQIEAALRS